MVLKHSANNDNDKIKCVQKITMNVSYKNIFQKQFLLQQHIHVTQGGTSVKELSDS